MIVVRVVAARLWLSVYVAIGSGFDVGVSEDIGTLVLARDVFEPPLSFQDLQPHVRSFGGGRSQVR